MLSKTAMCGLLLFTLTPAPGAQMSFGAVGTDSAGNVKTCYVEYVEPESSDGSFAATRERFFMAIGADNVSALAVVVLCYARG